MRPSMHITWSSRTSMPFSTASAPDTMTVMDVSGDSSSRNSLLLLARFPLTRPMVLNLDLTGSFTAWLRGMASRTSTRLLSMTSSWANLLLNKSMKPFTSPSGDGSSTGVTSSWDDILSARDGRASRATCLGSGSLERLSRNSWSMTKSSGLPSATWRALSTTAFTCSKGMAWRWVNASGVSWYPLSTTLLRMGRSSCVTADRLLGGYHVVDSRRAEGLDYHGGLVALGLEPVLLVGGHSPGRSRGGFDRPAA